MKILRVKIINNLKKIKKKEKKIIKINKKFNTINFIF